MTDINLKTRIAATVAYIITASALTLQYRQPFAVVYFILVGLVIALADRILLGKSIHNRTATAFAVSAFCHQTFFQIFYKTHGNTEQILTAVAIALFLSGVFTLTDEKKLPLSVAAVPLLFLTNTKLAFGYSILLFTVSFVKLQQTEKKQKGKSPKANSIRNLLIVSAVISVLCFAFCIYAASKDTHRIIEAYDYFLVHFKNIPFVLIASVYLLVRLLKSNIEAKAGIVAGFSLTLIASVVFYFVYGWTMVSLFCVTNVLFLSLMCLGNDETINLIKSNFIRHKYIFSAVIICMLM